MACCESTRKVSVSMSAWLLSFITDFIHNRALAKEALTAAASQGHPSQELQAGDDREVSFLSTKHTI